MANMIDDTLYFRGGAIKRKKGQTRNKYFVKRPGGVKTITLPNGKTINSRWEKITTKRFHELTKGKYKKNKNMRGKGIIKDVGLSVLHNLASNASKIVGDISSRTQNKTAKKILDNALTKSAVRAISKLATSKTGQK